MAGPVTRRCAHRMTVELRRPEACSLLSLRGRRAARGDSAQPQGMARPRAARTLGSQGALGLAPGPGARGRARRTRQGGRGHPGPDPAPGAARRHAPGHAPDRPRRPPRRRMARAAASLDDPAALLDLDLAALAAGTPPQLGYGPATRQSSWSAPTGAATCAAPRSGARASPPWPRCSATSLWESSHLGGHRFAPTVLLLPAGRRPRAGVDAGRARRARGPPPAARVPRSQRPSPGRAGRRGPGPGGGRRRPSRATCAPSRSRAPARGQ